MKYKKFFQLFILSFMASILFLAFLPKQLYAAAFTIIVPDDFTTIQEAINEAENQLINNPGDTYSVLVRPGTYSEQITLKSDIPVRGEETGRTIIAAGGTGTAVTADNITNVSLRNFTIRTAATGISVTNNASLTITNNIFRDITGTAINVQSGSAAIINNTFYNNGTAINRITILTEITNNIFSSNAVAISPSLPENIFNNCFHNNTANGPLGLDSIPESNENPDPLFVNISAGDFHLKVNSPCIDKGNNSAGSDIIDGSAPDIGAYGGPNMDTIPFPISGLTVVDPDITDNDIPLTWSANECYLITGYKIYYGTAPGTYGTPDSSSSTSYTITGLTPSPQTPPSGDPNLQTKLEGSGTITLIWNSVQDATAYEIRYNLQASPPAAPPNPPNPGDTMIDNVNGLSYPVGGLTDDIWYTFQVTAYAQETYYIAVTAIYDPVLGDFESDFSSEVTAGAGPKEYGGVVSEADDFAESITPFPPLPDEGCFIATAAYGYYSAPQVQALRDFRDHHLLTNAPGRAFVNWYYTYGPVGARFINKHPWLKPAVRVALLPAVGGAALMTRTSQATQVAILLFITALILYMLIQRRIRNYFGRT